MLYGSGSGSGSNIKWNKKSKIKNERQSFWEMMLLLKLKRHDFVQIFCCWKTLLNIVWIRNRNQNFSTVKITCVTITGLHSASFWVLFLLIWELFRWLWEGMQPQLLRRHNRPSFSSSLRSGVIFSRPAHSQRCTAVHTKPLSDYPKRGFYVLLKQL
jgi:hypothetical protein